MIQAVIFDLDGVIIDSTDAWSRARAAIVSRYGRPWMDQDQRHVMGHNSRQWSAYMRQTWNMDCSDEEVFRAVLAGVMSEFDEGVPAVMPGACDLVHALQGRYKLAVASSAPLELITCALRLAGLDKAFSVLVSADETAQGKPAPDVYLLAAARLGIAPDHCVAIEDSRSGIRAALAAGMHTIAVPNSAFPPGEDMLAAAHLVVPTLRALTPAAVEALALTPSGSST